jgi:ubiquinone/menaquinone biosynthesis C-methylase UbiE
MCRSTPSSIIRIPVRDSLYVCGMATATTRSYGRVFNEVAAEYDRNRPSYPDELIDHACLLAGIGSGDRVLEVGCGSGQLTRALLARGLHVTALDRGERLISLAAQNLEGTGEVEFVNARFEDAQLPTGDFRAVFSAAAFHWIDPEVSWRKVARLLRPGGTLALLQYCGLNDQHSIHDQEALLSALARIAPEIAADWPSYRGLATTVAGAEQRRENVSEVWAWLGSHAVAQAEAASLFSDVRIAAVPKLVEQTADELNALLRTASFYHRISPSQRQALESENVAIYERVGRPIRSGMVAALVTARRGTAVAYT